MKSKWHQGVLSAALAVSMTFGLWPTAVSVPALADDALPQDAPLASQAEGQPEQDPQLGQDSQPGQTEQEPQSSDQSEQKNDEEQGTEESAPAPDESEAEFSTQAEADEHTHDSITFAATDVLPNEAGDFYLTADVTITDTWKPVDGTRLCLNGHTITADIADATDGGCAILVDEGVTFSLYDCGDGVLEPAKDRVISAGVDSEGGGTFNMYGGTIKGFRAGVFTNLKVGDKEQGTSSKFGTFNLHGGTITGCTQNGVYVFSGTLNMYGGLITQNTTDTDGAGVYVNYSDFNMTGGVISKNIAKRNGGGLYVFRTEGIKISGGSIEGNSASGTELAQGEEGGNGGGVYVDANEVVPAMMRVTGGTIKDNSAAKLGGGVYPNKNGIVKISGNPQISGNTASSKTSNVHISGKPIDVEDELEDGASIGVTCGSDSDAFKTSAETAKDSSAFTKGYKGAGNDADPQTYYSSDDDAYLVAWTEDGEEARLVTAYNVVVEDSQNGTVTASATKARAGDTVTLTATPSDGYKLQTLSVLDANKKAVALSNNTFAMPASDVTVSATFEATQHTIAFDANGGTGTMDSQIVTAGESTTLNENKFTRTGYVFSSWNTKKDGSGTSYKDKAEVTPVDDMTLYAQWTGTTSSTTTSTASTGTSTSGTSATTLARTADPTSVVGAMAMLVAGAGAVRAGIRRRRR